MCNHDRVIIGDFDEKSVDTLYTDNVLLAEDGYYYYVLKGHDVVSKTMFNNHSHSLLYRLSHRDIGLDIIPISHSFQVFSCKNGRILTLKDAKGSLYSTKAIAGWFTYESFRKWFMLSQIVTFPDCKLNPTGRESYNADVARYAQIKANTTLKEQVGTRIAINFNLSFFTSPSYYKKEDYVTAQNSWCKFHNIEIGDTVRVLTKADVFNHQYGWPTSWAPDMDKYVGMNYKILGVSMAGIALPGHNSFPFYVLEKVV